MEARPKFLIYDVIIVGGGPSGLSTALILARARRAVLVLEAGDKRNEAALDQHAVFGADGERRSCFLKRAREQVLAYPTVDFRHLEALAVDIVPAGGDGKADGHPASATSTAAPGSSSRCSGRAEVGDGKPANGRMECANTQHFEVATADGVRWQGRKLVLTTGVIDIVPEVDGFEELFGTSVFHCVFCEGYECADSRVGVYGSDERGVHLALEMLQLSRDVMLLTDGCDPRATKQEWQLLKRHGIRIITDKLVRAIKGRTAGWLPWSCKAAGSCIFFNTGRRQRSELPGQMGLELDDRGDIVCDLGCGRVPGLHGLFVAGNNCQAPLQLIMTAASQGAIVGKAINSELLYEDLGLLEGGAYQDGERSCIRRRDRG